MIERATSSRATCRGCGAKIARDELRFGERLPNPFADEGGEMTHWFHLACAAFTRPEPFLETVAHADQAAGPPSATIRRSHSWTSSVRQTWLANWPCKFRRGTARCWHRCWIAILYCGRVWRKWCINWIAVES